MASTKDGAATEHFSRFNDIAWSQPSEQYPHGVIAGALDSGVLILWDAEKLRAGEGSEHSQPSE